MTRCRAGRLALAGLAALGAGCGRGGGEAERERPAVVVQVVTLEPTRVGRTVAAVGTLESPQATEIAAEFEGTVVFLDVPEGQEVPTGHVLARIDPQRARAVASVADARYRNARERYERLRALRTSQIVSPQELEDAEAELEAARGARADLATALARREVRAPFAGVLGLRQVSLGAYVEAGAPVVRLTQTRPLHLVFGVPERHVGEIVLDQVVRGVAGQCGPRFEARVSVIEPHVDAATRAVRVQAVVPNAEGRLLPGMSARVKVEVGALDDALLVPHEAVVRHGAERLVYTVGDGDAAAVHAVVLGEATAERVQVARGLEPGDVVVAAGHQKLRPGVRVSRQPWEPIENPNLSLGAVPEECPF